MYVREKIISLPSSSSPFPKNLAINRSDEKKIILSTVHKNCFNIIVTNNRFESHDIKQISIEDHKEVNYDMDYIIEVYMFLSIC